MANQPFVAKIIGIPHIPAITQVNVRAGAGTSTDKLFKIDVGTDNLQVLEVWQDRDNRDLGGKVFQWFRLVFPSGRSGFVRDDLIEVRGDGSAVGYGVVAQSTVAFNLAKGAVSTTPPTTIDPPTTEVEPPTTEVEPPTTTITVEDRGPGMVIAMSPGGGNVRQGPGTNNGIAFRITERGEATIQEVQPSQVSNDPLRWIKINFNGQVGWIREDLVRLKGNFEQFGLAFHDQYPNPTRNAAWQRDFNLDANSVLNVHWGWDHSGKAGVDPILAGPNGGLVIAAQKCQKCGSAGRSARDMGLSTSQIIKDGGWNFGYGHQVNVRYLNEQLPESTQQRLADEGKAGWHIFVNHAHLHSINVAQGQTLQPNQELGKLGNSGNSTGAHLHLETRAHPDASETQWWKMKAGLRSPEILFLR